MKKLINKISREQKTRLLLLLVLFVSGLDRLQKLHFRK